MIKNISKVFKSGLNRDNEFVHWVATSQGYKKLPTIPRSFEMECQFCGTNKFFLYKMPDKTFCWMCGLVCEGSQLPNDLSSNTIPPTLKRCVKWPLFCEINGIGNRYHDLIFEHILQEPKKIDCLRDFVKDPKDIIFMQGKPGVGKTFAALGACELFTRTDASCAFFTQSHLFKDWIAGVKGNYHCTLSQRLSKIKLLVIDDFGTIELSPGFMEFVRDLINIRIQWNNRGTIITTNMDDIKFSENCGDALSDRIKLGQMFEFKNKSRRKLGE